MGILNIKNLTFKYDDKIIFENLNLVIKKGVFLTILGSNTSGKTTLSLLLSGKLKGNIKYYNKPLKPYKSIRLWNNELNTKESVIDFLKDSADEKKLKHLIVSLQLTGLLDYEVSSLNYENKYLVELASILLSKPKVLLIDGVIEKLNKNNKENVIKVLNDYNSDGLTIINITSNEEDALYTSQTALICDKKIKIYQSKKLLADETLLKKTGLHSPFIVNLSNKLIVYNLIDKVYYTKESLVNDLWS